MKKSKNIHLKNKVIWFISSLVATIVSVALYNYVTTTWMSIICFISYLSLVGSGISLIISNAKDVILAVMFLASILLFDSSQMVIVLTFLFNTLFLYILNHESLNKETIFKYKIDKYNQKYSEEKIVPFQKIALSEKYYKRKQDFDKNLTLFIVYTIILMPTILYEMFSSMAHNHEWVQKLMSFFGETVFFKITFFLISDIILLIPIMLFFINTKERNILVKLQQYRRIKGKQLITSDDFDDELFEYIQKENDEEYNDFEISIMEATTKEEKQKIDLLLLVLKLQDKLEFLKTKSENNEKINNIIRCLIELRYKINDSNLKEISPKEIKKVIKEKKIKTIRNDPKNLDKLEEQLKQLLN